MLIYINLISIVQRVWNIILLSYIWLFKSVKVVIICIYIVTIFKFISLSYKSSYNLSGSNSTQLYVQLCKQIKIYIQFCYFVFSILSATHRNLLNYIQQQEYTCSRDYNVINSTINGHIWIKLEFFIFVKKPHIIL